MSDFENNSPPDAWGFKQTKIQSGVLSTALRQQSLGLSDYQRYQNP